MALPYLAAKRLLQMQSRPYDQYNSSSPTMCSLLLLFHLLQNTSLLQHGRNVRVMKLV